MTEPGVSLHNGRMRNFLLLALPALWLPSCGPKSSGPVESPATPVVSTAPAVPAPVEEKLEFPARFTGDAFAKTPEANRKIFVFFTDDGEHGWMQHENTAGAILFAKRLAAAIPTSESIVLRDTFPDETLLAQASSVILFCSGTDRHPLNIGANRGALEAAMKANKGLVCVHWALEAGTPEGSDFLKRNLGGYFEVNYSVNPMWNADFKDIPGHEITRGISPFSIYDEFYFNIRFPDVPGKRENLLMAIPPKRVVVLPEDGPRSNNPTVRASAGKPHVTAWAFTRPDGGRSFGFTGGHFHWDWKHDDHRRVLLNAIAWTGGVEIPASGLPDNTPSDEELLLHQDSPPVDGWKPMPGQPPMGTPANKSDA